MVPQPQDYSIVFFAPDGTPAGKFGRRGDGPGEFQSLRSAGWNGEILWAFASSQRRLVFVTPQLTLGGDHTIGELTASAGPSSVSLPRTNGAGTVMAVDSDSTMILSYAADLPDRDSTELHLFQTNYKMAVLRHLAPLPVGMRRMVRGTGSGFAVIPYASPPIHVASADGKRFASLVVSVEGSDANTIGVRVIDGSAEEVYTRRVPFTAELVPAGHADSLIRSRGALGELLHNVRLSPVFPPVNAALLGRDYSLWIDVRDGGADGRLWFVLDPAGTAAGHLVLPDSAQLREADLTNIWATAQDSSGVSHIVRYRLLRGR